MFCPIITLEKGYPNISVTSSQFYRGFQKKVALLMRHIWIPCGIHFMELILWRHRRTPCYKLQHVHWCDQIFGLKHVDWLGIECLLAQFIIGLFPSWVDVLRTESFKSIKGFPKMHGNPCNEIPVHVSWIAKFGCWSLAGKNLQPACHLFAPCLVHIRNTESCRSILI